MKTEANTILQDGPEAWDAIVIGAGLAGATSAYLLACEGLSVLLVEAKAFPRAKVCGGCLNDRALDVLSSAGLSGVLTQIGAQAFDSVEIVLRGRRVSVPVPRGIAVTREPLDAAIVQHAVQAGATFLPSTTAQVTPELDEDFRLVCLGPPQLRGRPVRARVVLACDGLGRPSLSGLGEFRQSLPEKSRLGLGVVVPAKELTCYEASGALQMVVGQAGYVGFSRCEAGLVSIAAAVDRSAMRSATDSGEVIASILEEAGVQPDPAIRNAAWRGTKALSQRANQVSGRRLLLLGDAAGYVEPFTGEGMAAALESARLAVPLALAARLDWRQAMAQEWHATYTTAVRRRQRACARLAWLLRRPRLAGLALRVVAGWPQLGAHAASAISSRRTEQETTAWAHQSPG